MSYNFRKSQKSAFSKSMILFLLFGISGILLTISTVFIEGFRDILIQIPIVTFSFVILVITSIFAPIGQIATSLLPNGRTRKTRAFLIAILIVNIIPISLQGITYLCPSIKFGDKDPQLLISETNGDYGIPNLMISFWTRGNSQNTIQWGDYEGNISTIYESEFSNQHIISLEDLMPSKKYWYNINSGDTYNFTTSKSDGNLTFAVGGDAHFGELFSDKSVTSTIFNSIKEKEFNYFIGLGDFADYGGWDKNWETCINTISPYTSQIPSRFAIGNHEGIFGGIKLYTEYMQPEKVGTEHNDELWNYINIGSIHFFILEARWNAVTLDPKKIEWLQEKLELIDENDWIFILNHGVYLSSTTHDKDNGLYDLLSPIFINEGVDAVFSGHVHGMECLERDGIVYNTVGSLGSRRFDKEPEEISDYSIWSRFYEHGFCGIEIKNNICNITYYDQYGISMFSKII